MSLWLAIALVFQAAPAEVDQWRTLLKDGKDSEAVTAVQARAKDGDAEALDFLGWFYDTGRGLPHDATQAAEAYRHAAEAGNKHAQWRYGVMLDTGEGVAKDPVAAFGWIEKAAAQDFRNGIISLGVMYSNGHGVARDDARALELYKQAARLHALGAFAQIGLVYAKGEGVPADRTEALAWLIIGATSGDDRARQLLQELGADSSEDELKKAAERATAISKELGLPED